MNDTYIVTLYVIIEDTLNLMGYVDDGRAQVKAAEVLTVAIVAAKYFENHQARALGVLVGMGYIRRISESRFNRRLHQLGTVLEGLMPLISDLWSSGTVFVIDTMPVPVCKRVRAKRCRKVQGRDFYGYCASKQEHFFGWYLHLVCDAQGVPVAFDLLPARWDELVAVQDLLATLPAGSCVVADKGYLSYQEQLLAYLHGGVRLVAKFRKNMRGNSEADSCLIRQYRPRIETLNSQLEKMGLQRLHARTNQGFALKILASLFAVALTNAL
jgi:hypothetical protein